MHRVAFSLPAWKALPAGGEYELDMVYYLPITGPANYAVTINGKEYAFKFEQPNLPLGDLSTGGDSGGGEGSDCSSDGVNTYPNWPQTDWQGNPSHAGSGDQIIYNDVIYKANWYTSSIPESNGSWSKVCNI